jgi:hypothetical protein
MLEKAARPKASQVEFTIKNEDFNQISRFCSTRVVSMNNEIVKRVSDVLLTTTIALVAL